jgi:1-acyl-sn-glycerol-3-phosphate acyltransferase
VIPAFRTALALFVVSLYVLLVGPPGLLWTMLSGRIRLLYAAGHLGIRIGFRLVGIRLRMVGEEHVLAGRPAVYVSNHGSNIDPPALFSALSPLFPKLRVLYKAELRRLPVLVWVFDAAGFVPVERANRGQSLPAIDRARQALVDGASFLIFPEGTRSPEGTLLPFKKGGFIMAIGAQVPVVPVVVSGGRDAMRKGSLLIRPATITIAFKEPIPTTGLTLADRDGLIARVRDAMTEATGEN